jgi:flagellar biosynthesis protein
MAESEHQNAVALAYRDGDAAPKVVARGRGLIAEEIIRRANAAGVYVHQSRELVGLLMQVDLDQHVPPALYRVVAELLAWLYRTERAQLPDPAVRPDQPGA